MQWSAISSQVLGSTGGKALQLLYGIIGLIGVIYGLQVLMVERAQIPLCSAEVLQAVGEQNFLQQQKMTVEVAGAVVRPGVWQLAIGSRVAEAIDKAGGFSQRADRMFAAKGLNLADPLKDGQKIYVPFEDEALPAQPNQDSTALSADTGAISINSASLKELQTLPGIGEVRAGEIVENRPYAAIAELLTKAVLTESLFNDLKDQLTL